MQSRTNRFLEPHLLHKPAADIWALFMIKMLQGYGYGLKNPICLTFDLFDQSEQSKMPACNSFKSQTKKNSLPHRSQLHFTGVHTTAPSLGAMRNLRSLGLSRLQCAALLCMGAPPVLSLDCKVDLFNINIYIYIPD